ncbi:MAG: polysaccharide deacetylase family protein [Anaerolineales bacterium]
MRSSAQRTNPIAIALQGKGFANFLRRGVSITRHYGPTPRKMHRALDRFTTLLRRYECPATFPITAVALRRHPQRIQQYAAAGFEFAIHGYRHVDHAQLSLAEHLDEVAQAQSICEEAEIAARGFRGPYLHAAADTLTALRRRNLTYDSSQGLAWDVLDGRETPAYREGLKFYGALSAAIYPSLPVLEDGLVRMPYSLPDDEALIERLPLKTPAQMDAPWLAILERTYTQGELFVLGLHPERIAACEGPLEAVLRAARRRSPAVWMARLDEIAAWWRARAAVAVEITEAGADQLHVIINGPPGTIALARSVAIDAPTTPWGDGYQQVTASSFTIRVANRPFIGLAPDAPPALADFLHQQGYIVQISAEARRYSYYLAPTAFTAEDQRPLLAEIEGTDKPLVRLGRWPNGARSALAITGDIDALTLWDYGLRFLGK